MASQQNEFIAVLKLIAQMQNTALEKLSSNYPSGVCYLTGHTMSEGLNKANFKAKKVSGSLVISDRKNNRFVYGKGSFAGNNLGDYHTWCVMEYQGKEYIIDSSIKYIKDYINIHFRNPLPNIPDIIVTEKLNPFFRYEEDKSMEAISKTFLEKVSPQVIDAMIGVVEATANELFV